MTAQLTTGTAISFSACKLFYIDESQQPQIEGLQALIVEHQLSLILSAERLEGKLNQKHREQLSATSNPPTLLLDDKNKLSWISAGMTVAPEWDKLQRRVVSAGRKSELLLQAAKITADSHVLDATAGFGHDSLILASTGAHVTMLEQQPLMALLLLAEQQRMSAQPNWQKLMMRLQIINTDALNYFEHCLALTKANNDSNESHEKSCFDVVYLDPMFPEDSYQDRKTGKGAKVGKHMQALHQLAAPPTVFEEQQLLQQAQALIGTNNKSKQYNHSSQSGRVIIKRPQHAPLFAKQTPDDSWQNEVVRFDGYLL